MDDAPRSDPVTRPPISLGPLPVGRRMVTCDAQWVPCPVNVIFGLARDVEQWPRHLSHYRVVRFLERASDQGGIVEMSANRPFGPLNWPTWWLSEMEVDAIRPAVRFRHIGGVTTGMDVEWAFAEKDGGTQVTLWHVWDGPGWPVIGAFAATAVIGPVFIHGIASRTLAGLAQAAQRMVR